MFFVKQYMNILFLHNYKFEITEDIQMIKSICKH